MADLNANALLTGQDPCATKVFDLIKMIGPIIQNNINTKHQRNCPYSVRLWVLAELHCCHIKLGFQTSNTMDKDDLSFVRCQ